MCVNCTRYRRNNADMQIHVNGGSEQYYKRRTREQASLTRAVEHGCLNTRHRTHRRIHDNGAETTPYAQLIISIVTVTNSLNKSKTSSDVTRSSHRIPAYLSPRDREGPLTLPAVIDQSLVDPVSLAYGVAYLPHVLHAHLRLTEMWAKFRQRPLLVLAVFLHL